MTVAFIEEFSKLFLKVFNDHSNFKKILSKRCHAVSFLWCLINCYVILIVLEWSVIRKLFGGMRCERKGKVSGQHCGLARSVGNHEYAPRRATGANHQTLSFLASMKSGINYLTRFIMTTHCHCHCLKVLATWLLYLFLYPNPLHNYVLCVDSFCLTRHYVFNVCHRFKFNQVLST